MCKKNKNEPDSTRQKHPAPGTRQKKIKFPNETTMSDLTRAHENTRPTAARVENVNVDEASPLQVLGLLTANETGDGGVQEPTIGALTGPRKNISHETPPIDGTRRDKTMKAVVERCAGIDIAKTVLNVCVMTGAADLDPRIELGKYGTFNADLGRLRDWLIASGCTHVAMESTGSYWKPVYAALEGSGVEVILANGEDVKARRGHKTDWNDCQFLAHLLRHGMIRPSFIPPQAIRDLRDLTRRRRQLIGDAVSERNRVQKVLEEANIKLGSVLSDIFGVSGQLMLEKLLEGEPDLAAIADLAKNKARLKIPEILQSLEGHRLRDHHRRMLRFSLGHLAFLEAQLSAIEAEVLDLIEREGYAKPFALLQSIPGVQEISAASLLAETGADMSVFPTEAQLSSWIGVCPGNRISAGKNRSAAITRGNRWARTALVECAWAATVKNGCHLKERFRKLSVKGRKPALIAVAHSLAVILYKTLQSGIPYQEPNQPAPDERKRQRLIRHYVRRLGKLGVAVSSLRQQPAPKQRSGPPAKARHSCQKESGGDAY
jgi:transposase